MGRHEKAMREEEARDAAAERRERAMRSRVLLLGGWMLAAALTGWGLAYAEGIWAFYITLGVALAVACGAVWWRLGDRGGDGWWR